MWLTWVPLFFLKELTQVWVVLGRRKWGEVCFKSYNKTKASWSPFFLSVIFGALSLDIRVWFFAFPWEGGRCGSSRGSFFYAEGRGNTNIMFQNLVYTIFYFLIFFDLDYRCGMYCNIICKFWSGTLAFGILAVGGATVEHYTKAAKSPHIFCGSRAEASRKACGSIRPPL